MTGYAKPLPHVDARSRPYWEGAKQHELRLLRCAGCGTHRFVPFRLCPSCGSRESSWQAVSGKGEVWSWCVFHRAYFPGFAAELPYSVVMVKLDEGPRLYSNLVGVPAHAIRIGMRVRARFEDVTDAVSLVKFEPEETA